MSSSSGPAQPLNRDVQGWDECRDVQGWDECRDEELRAGMKGCVQG